MLACTSVMPALQRRLAKIMEMVTADMLSLSFVEELHAVEPEKAPIEANTNCKSGKRVRKAPRNLPSGDKVANRLLLTVVFKMCRYG